MERRSSLPLPRVVWAASLDKQFVQELERRGLRTIEAGGSWELSRQPLYLDLGVDCALNQLMAALTSDRTAVTASDLLTQPRRLRQEPHEPQETQEPQKDRGRNVTLKPPKVSVAEVLLQKLEEGIKEGRPEVAMAALKELEDWGRRCDDDSGNQVAQAAAVKLRYGLMLSTKRGQVSLAEASMRALEPFVERFDGARTVGMVATQRLVDLVDERIHKGDYGVVVAAASALLEFQDFPGANVSQATYGLVSVLRESLQKGQAADAKMAIGAIQKFAKGGVGLVWGLDASTIRQKTLTSQSAKQVVDALLMTIEDSFKLDGGSVAEAAASVLLEMMNRCKPVLHETVANKLLAIWKHQSAQEEAQELSALLRRIALEMSSMVNTGCRRMR